MVQISPSNVVVVGGGIVAVEAATPITGVGTSGPSHIGGAPAATAAARAVDAVTVHVLCLLVRDKIDGIFGSIETLEAEVLRFGD